MIIVDGQLYQETADRAAAAQADMLVQHMAVYMAALVRDVAAQVTFV